MNVFVTVGNIVSQPDAQALVNSANANLRLGSGVAGAIHTAAGPELEAYCRQFAPLALGSAVITPGFRLPNPWVIHTRAAHFITTDEPEQHLHNAIIAALRVAAQHGVQSLALPAIGTGVFKCPPPLAAQITAQALRTVSDEVQTVDWVRIVVPSQELQALYAQATAQAFGPRAADQ